MEAVLVPQAGGVLSALGLAIADIRRDYVSPLLAEVGSLSANRLEAAFAAMEASAAADLLDPAFRRRADLRYRGQSFELTIDAGRIEELAPRFHDAHELRYGYGMANEAVELVSVRLIATVPTPPLEMAGPAPARKQSATARSARFDGDWAEARVFARDAMAPGDEVTGPAILEMQESTAVINASWGGRIDDHGTLVLRRR